MISNQKQCPNCRTIFNEKTMKYIKDAESRSFDKLKKNQSKEKRLQTFRKQVQHKVYKIMLNRIKQKLKQQNNDRNKSKQKQKQWYEDLN